VFPVGYKFNEESDLVVLRIDDATSAAETLTLNSDYTVQGAGNEAGGSVTMAAPLAVGKTLTITRIVDILQLTDLRNQGKFFAEVHEDAFDKFVMIMQQLFQAVGDSLQLNPARNRWDAKGKRIINVGDPVAAQDAVTKSWLEAYITALLQTSVGPVQTAASVIYVGPDGEFYTLQDLANTSDPAKGAALVGYHSRTVYDKLSEAISVTDFGAVADGTNHPLSEFYGSLAEAQEVYPYATSLTQSIDWAAIQAALNSDYVDIRFPQGRYIVNSNLTRTTDITMSGDGVIVLGPSVTFTLSGSLTALPDLSADITKTSRLVSFASAPSVSAGDVIIAYNPTDYSWSPHRAYYRDGSFFRIHSVTGSTATVYGLPADTYASADMDMYRVDGIRVIWDGPTVEVDSSTVGAGVIVRHGVDCNLSGYRGSGGSSYSLEIDRCFRVDMFGGTGLNNSAYVDDEYGIAISNSSGVNIIGGEYAATRHAIALGGRDAPGAVPSRDILISNMTLQNTGDDIGAADIHGNCDRVTYSNCIINAHANMAGRDVEYKECRIQQRTGLTDGSCVFGSEIVGGTYKLTDCELVTSGDGVAFGYVNLTMAQALRHDWRVIIRNLTITGGGGGALAKAVRISPVDGETKKITVDIRGVHNSHTSALCVLYYRCDSNTSFTPVSGGIVVDDIYGPNGMYMVYPTGAALAGALIREMRQSGYVDVTTTVSVSAVAAPVTLRYPYSKIPTVAVGISSPGGTALAHVAGQPASPISYTLSSTQVRPAIVAPANFTAGTDVRLHWTAGIEEC
jgi:hypothetical protein